jgi:hypothetical protein
MPVPPKKRLLRAGGPAMTGLAIRIDDFRIQRKLLLGMGKREQIITNLITPIKFVVDKIPFSPELDNV